MAIAFDAATDGGLFLATSSATYSHTCTGSNRILFVFVNITSPSTTISGVTYNTVALTHITDSVGSPGTNALSSWYLVAPATGANNIVVSLTGSNNLAVMSSSYTGAKQSAQPDNSTTNEGTGVSSLTTSLITVADNSWTVLSVAQNLGQPSAGTGSTQRLSSATTDNGLYDSNAAITPAGSTSMAVSLGGSRNITAMMVSFSPPATASSARRLGLLGVGQ